MPGEPDRTLTYDDLLQIVELIKASEQFSEFRLKVGDIEIELRRRRTGDAAQARSRGAPAARTDDTSVAAPSNEPAPAAPARDRVSTERAHGLDESALPPGAIVVRAPMVGTFYRAPSPGAVPFVAEGQAVEPDTTVCIIEVMKLMNSIHAGARGTVRSILVADGGAVETGAPLIVLDPA